MYGLAGSGKPTLARELSAGSGAVRFTLDKWMTRGQYGEPPRIT